MAVKREDGGARGGLSVHDPAQVAERGGARAIDEFARLQRNAAVQLDNRAYGWPIDHVELLGGHDDVLDLLFGCSKVLRGGGKGAQRCEESNSEASLGNTMHVRHLRSFRGENDYVQ
ncbi:hypothetical protein [Sphingosinithalassobacter sp. LHW66-3]|uniref:hypothetical protein n=1 Tax=Sphingosinithalassobacter sp. LHW66-3 TaxID=3424718 RepID=UPI003D6AFA96